MERILQKCAEIEQRYCFDILFKRLILPVFQRYEKSFEPKFFKIRMNQILLKLST